MFHAKELGVEYTKYGVITEGKKFIINIMSVCRVHPIIRAQEQNSMPT